MYTICLTRLKDLPIPVMADHKTRAHALLASTQNELRGLRWNWKLQYSRAGLIFTSYRSALPSSICGMLSHLLCGSLAECRYRTNAPRCLYLYRLLFSAAEANCWCLVTLLNYSRSSNASCAIYLDCSQKESRAVCT